MTWKKTNLKYWVPDWQWCEMPNPGNKTKTGERCRFCQEIKKRGDATRYHCLIHNTDLYVEAGSVVKDAACLLWDTNQATHAAPEVAKAKTPNVAKCVIKSLKEYVKLYKNLREEGYPEYIAIDLALEGMVNQWKS